MNVRYADLVQSLGAWGEVELTWSVPYSWIPETLGDNHTPPEGGVWLEGDPLLVGASYYPVEAEPFHVEDIEEGSIAETLIVGKYGYPDDDECYGAAYENEEE